jgi:hypothetical protein
MVHPQINLMSIPNLACTQKYKNSLNNLLYHINSVFVQYLKSDVKINVGSFFCFFLLLFFSDILLLTSILTCLTSFCVGP